MALSQAMTNYLAQAFGPAALRNGLQVRGDDRVNLARQLGLQVEDLGEGNYRYDENALSNAWMKQQYDQYVPKELRDYFSGPGGGRVFMGANDQMLMIDPATGRPVQAWNFAASDDEGNVLDNLKLPDRLGLKYGQQLGAEIMQKEVWDDRFLDKAMPIVASLPVTMGAASALSGVLGGGILGNMGAGAIIGTATGGDPVTGALKGGVGGMFGSPVSADGGAIDMGVGLGDVWGSGDGWEQAFSNWSGTDVEIPTDGGGGMEWWEAFDGWDGTDVQVPTDNWADAFSNWTGTDTFGNAMPPAITDPVVQEAIKAGALTQTSPGVWELTQPWLLPPETSLLDLATKFGSKAWDLIRGNGGGGINLNLGGNGGIFGGGSIFDTALATAPILAAINYAKNQGPFDTSRLTSTYDQFQPSALAFEYDQNTARGREALTSSLTNRGVMGSSFGNMDMTNFNTTRDLGRQSLLNQGFAARGDIAAKILDAQVKERALKNDLYGRSLLALGNVFGGRK